MSAAAEEISRSASRTSRSARRWRSPRDAGIHRLAIPTPFMVGRVNAYLIEDSPLTLVDSGPNSAKALDELEQALAARGHAIEDIELLVVTHQHIDHFGLASILARRSGAEVAALDGLAPFLASYGQQTELDDRFAERLMLRHGIPPEVVTALRAVSASFRAWGSAVEVTRPLADGASSSCATARCACCTAPATAPRTRCSSTRSRSAASILLAADHLIAHISSNPLLARPLGRGRRESDDEPTRARRRSSPTWPRWRRRARWSSRSCSPATGGRSSTTSR